MSRRSLELLAALALATIPLAGCGEDPPTTELPPHVVAEVKGRAITRANLAHAMIARLAPSTGRVSRPYRPGDVEGCVAATRKAQPAADPARSKRRCTEQRDRDERAALRLLIQGRWYALEAKRRRMRVETFRSFARIWGNNAGVDPKAMLEVTAARGLQVRLVQAASPVPAISAADARRHYRAHRERYGARPFREAEADVLDELQQQRFDRSVARLDERLGKRYGSDTACATAYEIPECR